jgi:hypothetical protein
MMTFAARLWSVAERFTGTALPSGGASDLDLGSRQASDGLSSGPQDRGA